MQHHHVQLLQHFQRTLVRINDLGALPPVGDFLACEARATSWVGPETWRGEVLIIRSAPDADLEVGLFLAPWLIETFAQWSEAPFPCAAARWSHVSAVIEGLSHFNLLCHAAAFERPLTQLELEIQADLDRFSLLAWLLHSRTDRAFKRYNPAELWSFLFDSPKLSDVPGSIEWKRYRTAFRCARTLTLALLPLLAADRWHAFLQKLRTLYRLPLSAKLTLSGQLG